MNRENYFPKRREREGWEIKMGRKGQPGGPEKVAPNGKAPGLSGTLWRAFGEHLPELS